MLSEKSASTDIFRLVFRFERAMMTYLWLILQ